MIFSIILLGILRSMISPKYCWIFLVQYFKKAKTTMGLIVAFIKKNYWVIVYTTNANGISAKKNITAQNFNLFFTITLSS